jgi:hypothetical protein
VCAVDKREVDNAGKRREGASHGSLILTGQHLDSLGWPGGKATAWGPWLLNAGWEKSHVTSSFCAKAGQPGSVTAKCGGSSPEFVVGLRAIFLNRWPKHCPVGALGKSRHAASPRRYRGISAGTVCLARICELMLVCGAGPWELAAFAALGALLDQ